MNKREFLNQLKQGLKGLPKEELDDILYDYNEHIDSALETGKSEEEITRELGSPRKIAKQHKAEIYFVQADQKRTTGSAFKAIIAGIGLSVFNIIFVLPLIFGLYAALVAVFMSFVAVSVAGLVVVVAGIIMLGFVPGLAAVLVGIGITCLGILFCFGMAWLIKIITLGIVSYGKANVGIVRRTEGL